MLGPQTLTLVVYAQHSYTPFRNEFKMALKFKFKNFHSLKQDAELQFELEFKEAEYT